MSSLDREAQRVWTVHVCVPCRHPFPLWSIHLNELTPELRAKLPPTDERLRPDIRMFEHGFYHEVRTQPALRSVTEMYGCYPCYYGDCAVTGLSTGHRYA